MNAFERAARSRKVAKLVAHLSTKYPAEMLKRERLQGMSDGWWETIAGEAHVNTPSTESRKLVCEAFPPKDSEPGEFAPLEYAAAEAALDVFSVATSGLVKAISSRNRDMIAKCVGDIRAAADLLECLTGANADHVARLTEALNRKRAGG